MRISLDFGGGSRLLLGLCLAFFEGREFATVAEQLLDQRALRLNGVALFYDQKGHQTVGDQKQHREDRKQGVPRFGSDFRSTKKCRHLRPR